jgi:hypothetical protein
MDRRKYALVGGCSCQPVYIYLSHINSVPSSDCVVVMVRLFQKSCRYFQFTTYGYEVPEMILFQASYLYTHSLLRGVTLKYSP